MTDKVYSRKDQILKWLGIVGWLCFFCLIAFSIYRGVTTQGKDFNVYYQSGFWVLNGLPEKIYHHSPDRYIYGPGFAWLCAPLAYFSKVQAYLIFTFLKTIALIAVIREVRRHYSKSSTWIEYGQTAFGVLFFARPLIIDFEYGQMNTFLSCGAFLFVSLMYRKTHHKIKSIFAGAFFGAFAITKLMTLPVAIVFLLKQPRQDLKNWTRLAFGFGIGAFLILGVPWIGMGTTKYLPALTHWWGEIQSRGMPLETHNQSMHLFLIRIFTDTPSRVILADASFNYGLGLIHFETAKFLGKLFSGFCALFFFIYWIKLDRYISKNSKTDFLPILLGVGILIPVLSSHLIWKHYFIHALPMSFAFTTFLVQQFLKPEGFSFLRPLKTKMIGALLFLFAWQNLTSLSFVGRHFAGIFEAASVMLWGVIFWFGFLFWFFKKWNAPAIEPSLPKREFT